MLMYDDVRRARTQRCEGCDDCPRSRDFNNVVNCAFCAYDALGLSSRPIVTPQLVQRFVLRRHS